MCSEKVHLPINAFVKFPVITWHNLLISRNKIQLNDWVMPAFKNEENFKMK